MKTLLEFGGGFRVKRHVYFLTIILLGVCFSRLSAEETIAAYTVDGKGVHLHEDGTWEYSGEIGFFDVERNGIESVDEISIGDLPTCILTDVTDGDTIKVAFANPAPGIQMVESIRMLGIDAPELAAPTGPEPLAIEARDFVVERTAEPTLYLAFESRWRGDFGRLLAYVFTTDGSLLNAELLSRGLASVYNKEPCHFHQYFVALEVAARTKTVGMWTTPITGIIIIRQIFNDGRGEYLELWNRSDQIIDLSEWYLRDEQSNQIDIPFETKIEANGSLYILSGAGIAAPSSSYIYPTKTPVWNNTGDTAKLYDDDGDLVAEYGY